MFNCYVRLLRLNQPTGIWLLLWPSLWSIAIASETTPDLKLMAIFTVGSILMRAAGCIINDLFDIEFDQKVERTKTRPLASGEISKHQALITLFILLIISLGLLLCLNNLAIKIGLFSIIPVIIYPFMKRITFWPQAFLGLTFNLGAIVGYVAAADKVTFTSAALYLAGFFWTLGYDTIYAHQDKYDDALIGVKSTALKFADKTKDWLQKFYNGLLICLFLAGKLVGLSTWFFYGFIFFILLLYWQINTLDYDNPDDCLKKFKSNVYFGLLVFIFIVLGKL
jgi:4-hydroxybenzoate polyprenyl transferase